MRASRLGVAVIAALVALPACGGGGGGGGGGGNGAASGPAVRLSLVAYSTPQEAYQQIIDAFRKTPEGRNVTFTQSYGASGDQSRAVAGGLSADIVAFSLEPDITRLVTAGLVDPTWNAGADKGMITNSVVALVVRKGNPKNIHTWSDLTKPGVEVITPNPFTSGGARWNVMAAFGQAVKSGRSEADATAYLADLFKHVPVQDGSAREALQTFTGGKGDVMLAYENEAIFAQQHGQPVDYVVPDSTILIENPIAVTKNTNYPQQAKAFLDFLHGTTAQAIFAKSGYRPLNAAVKSPHPFPKPAGQFTIGDLGGWPAVAKKFFDTTNGIMAGVERGVGVTVG